MRTCGSFWAGCAAIIAPSADLATEIRNRGSREDRRDRVARHSDRHRRGCHPSARPGRPAARRRDGRPTPWSSPRSAAWPPRRAPTSSSSGGRGRANPIARLLLVIGGGPSEEALRARAAAPDLAGPTCTSPARCRGWRHWRDSRAPTSSPSPRGPRPRDSSWPRRWRPACRPSRSTGRGSRDSVRRRGRRHRRRRGACRRPARHGSASALVALVDG